MKNHLAFESVYFFFSGRDLMTLSLKVVPKNKIKVLEKKKIQFFVQKIKKD